MNVLTAFLQTGTEWKNAWDVPKKKPSAFAIQNALCGPGPCGSMANLSIRPWPAIALSRLPDGRDCL